MTAKQRATRAGFTMVELLMVIAIIAILAALLFAATLAACSAAYLLARALPGLGTLLGVPAPVAKGGRRTAIC